jgi:hypothetical protein
MSDNPPAADSQQRRRQMLFDDEQICCSKWQKSVKLSRNEGERVVGGAGFRPKWLNN